MDRYINDIFPKNGRWSCECYERPKHLLERYMPCHLRDSVWLAKYLQKVLADRVNIVIGIKNIKKYVETSKNFEQARHNYELEIVEWQIMFMLNGGEGWLIPDGYDELSLLVSPNVDILFRAAIVKTLLAIGMDEQVVEEGIEKNANLWRKQYMLKAFAHKYEPFLYGKGQIEPADKNHKQNWLKSREIDYYCTHRESVDNYGKLTEAMQMPKQQMIELIQILSEQNAKRMSRVDEWKSMSLKEREENHTRRVQQEKGEEFVEQIFNEVVSSFNEEQER